MIASRPRVLLLATGGTIASEINAERKKVYKGASSGIDVLVRAADVGLADLAGEQIASIGSQDMDFPVWRQLHERISRAFGQDEADAVVVTHGTDTMEETAFFLDLVCPSDRPVVLTGAMRPANAVGADGPRNLIDAVRVAVDPAARGRGVLIVMNDAIHGARTLHKAGTDGVDAFQSGVRGTLGKATPAKAIFHQPAPATRRRYPLPSLDRLPSVGVLFCHADMDMAIVDALLAAPMAGVVVAGIGDGNIPAHVIQALAAAAARGLVVVRSTRIDEGEVPRNVEVDDDRLGFVAARDLSPHKSRILLQLLLANGITESGAIQRAFDPA